MSKHNLICGKLTSPYSTKKAKRAFTTLSEALVKSKIQSSWGRVQRPYLCKVCGNYHLTTSGNR
jgi:hypothetical protein